MATLSARDRAEILWKQHIRQADDPKPASAASPVDAKTERLRRLRLAKETAEERAAGGAVDRDRWLADYGRHLALLYAPRRSVPEDLDGLIGAVAARIAARS